MKLFKYFTIALACTACEGPVQPAEPQAPFGLQLAGGNLSSTREVQVRGSAEAGVTIELFVDAACAGSAAATGTSEAFQLGGLELTAPPNQVSRFSARAVRGEANSACSAAIEFTHDDVPPAAPLTSRVTGVVSGAMPRVRVDGSAEAGSLVRMFTNPACTGTAAQETTTPTGSFGIELAVTPNAETSLTALALDAAGNQSPCSSPPLLFAHDGQPPLAPVLLALLPAGPSSDPQPVLSGTAEAGSTVNFFSDAACTIGIAGGGPVGSGGTFQLPVTVLRNATTSLRAKAVDQWGNRSPCSSPLSYRHDDLAPALPVFAASTPASPSRTALQFQLPVTAEAGATVELFTAGGCTGTPTFSAVASSGVASFTLNLTANTRQALSARAMDAAGNVSGCASSQLEHDDVAPALAMWTGSMPASPTNQAPTFTLSGTGEVGATLRLYRTSTCTTLDSTSVIAAAGTFALTASITRNTTRSFSATLTDPAGNVSACSAPFALTHDDVAPPAPIFWGTLPPSPSKSTGPVRFLGLSQTNSTVRLHTNSACSGLATASALVTDLISGSPSQGHFSVSTSPVLGGTLQVFALAADAAGNTSPCTATSLSYEQRATSAWSDEATVAVASTTGTFMLPSVELLPSGDAVAVWVRNQLLTSGVMTATLSNGTWSTPVEFATTGALTNPPQVVSDASGTVLVTWTQSSTTWVARRSSAGVWGTPENLGTTSYGRTPGIALDGAGNGVIVSERFITSSVRITARRSTGAAWGAESLISDPNYSSFAPKVSVSPGGRAVVIYSRNTGSGTAPIDELWSVTGEAGSAWGAPAQRSVAMNSRDDSAIEVTSTGDAIAAWMQYPTYNTPGTPMVSQSSGTTWGAASALSATTTSARGLWLKSFSNQEALVVWSSTANGLMTARRSATAVWGAAAAVPGALKAFDFRLATEPGGRAGLAWATGDGSGTAQYFWFSTFAPGGAWSTPQLLDFGATTNDGVALSLDGQGRMVAVWTHSDGTQSKLMARRLD